MNCSSSRIVVCGSVALLLLTAVPTSATHFPGHDICAQSQSLQLPGPKFFSGQGMAVFITYLGPPSDAMITNTTFDITYVSDGEMPAAELEFLVGVGLVGGFAEVSVLGR